jgi:GAF domain-containing protein
LFTYDVATDELVVACTAGEAATRALRGTRVELGQRLSGWVAANRQAIVNSDPALDLGDDARQGTQLRSCLSTPLLRANQLIGVLTVYAIAEGAFTDEDRAAIEAVSRIVAPAAKAAVDVESKAGRKGEALLASAR